MTNLTTNNPRASAFDGLFAGNDNKASSPLASFLSKPNQESDSKSEGKKKSGKVGKEKKEKRTDILVGNDGTVNPRLASKAVSLILFEEVSSMCNSSVSMCSH